MLLKVGVVMSAVAVMLAVGAALVVNLRAGGDSALAVAPVEPRTIEAPLAPEPPDAPRPEEPRREPETLPVAAEDWPEPTAQDLAAFDAPRVYEPRSNASMTLTVPALGLVEAPVLNSDSQQALDAGIIHLPQTPMPWDEAEQKNVYLAGHRIGYPGTGSHLIFYNLTSLRPGDAITIKDREGRPYRYEVSQIFVVGPLDTWAAEPVRGRDMLTLQTCTPIPTFENRLVVRADRV